MRRGKNHPRQCFVVSPCQIVTLASISRGFHALCDWVSVYYLWRPNLPDEADNHVLELAVAGGAQVIVTGNPTDFERSALRFPDIDIVSPRDFVKRGGAEHGNDDYPATG